MPYDDVGAQHALAAIVEDAHRVAGRDRALAGVGGMQVSAAVCAIRVGRDCRRSSSCCRRSWARSFRAGYLLAQGRVAEPRFDGRRVVERLGVELALARRACRSRLRRRAGTGRADVQADEVLGVELFERDACEEGVRRIEQRRGSCRLRYRAKQGSSKPMRRGQAAEDFDVRQGLAGRWQGGTRQLQVVVAVGESRGRCVRETWWRAERYRRNRRYRSGTVRARR